MQAITLNAGSPGVITAGTGTSATGGATAVPIQLTFNGGYVALNNLVRRMDASSAWPVGRCGHRPAAEHQ